MPANPPGNAGVRADPLSWPIRVPPWARAVLIGLGGVAVLVLALLLGGGRPEPAPPGIADPGMFTGWGLPIVKLMVDLAAVTTIGLLLFGLLAPAKAGVLDTTAGRAVRTAGVLAWVWAAAAAAALVFEMSDQIGAPVWQLNYQQDLASFIAVVAQARALAVVIVLAVVVAAASRGIRTLNGTALVLLLALAAVVPPALSGHSSSAADHDLATSSLLVHLAAISLWVGGLFALVAYGRSKPDLRVAAPRFSQIALWCFVAAGVSGLLNAWVRLGAIDQLWASRYGWLVIGKLIALTALGGFGWWHRRRTLRSLAAGVPRSFLRFALGEAAVMAATVGLAVGLSRTPPPVPDDVPVSGVSIAESIIGWPVPPATFERVLTLWRPDALVLMVAVLAVVAYVHGLRRLRIRGVPWPVSRTISWLAGVAVAVVVLCGGLATYAPAMFSMHMVQHMTLSMLVPILLALGAPITLALRALPANKRGGDRGAREWILEILHSRVARVVTHPVVALALYVVTLYAFYFSPLFEWAMDEHIAHMLMIVHFVGVGSIYFWPIIGLDPMPRKLPPLGRMLLLFASMPFHAFFGVIIMMSTTVIAGDWYAALKLPWIDPLTDQNTGGGIAWGTAELPVLAVLLVVIVAWHRSERRAAVRADRRGDAELEEYNAMLARLAAHDRNGSA